ncbi:type II secretion system protein GspD [Rhodopirellula sp. MGV]|uniref:type II secretion system protein GspD n=1 Tax=Rhodopirellula sp. MGV TaxID=2023130 RepID=UPI000B97C22B|nr:hypothetical protein [Rhodopirellula sp. MGV]OYP38403.1 hypothetical protein CGZ80_02345 [Rhodopirellula sp. MGV]PNY34177.1 hypothetical protein C2E31_24485 [Rhodopirellula baltica]
MVWLKRIQLKRIHTSWLGVSFFRGHLVQEKLAATVLGVLIACTVVTLCNWGTNASAARHELPSGMPATPEVLNDTASLPKLFSQQIETQQTELAVLHSGLPAFARVERAARLRPVYEAMIETEETRLAIRNQMRHRMSMAKRIEVPAIQTSGDPQQGGSQSEVRPVSAMIRHNEKMHVSRVPALTDGLSLEMRGQQPRRVAVSELPRKVAQATASQMRINQFCVQPVEAAPIELAPATVAAQETDTAVAETVQELESPRDMKDTYPPVFSAAIDFLQREIPLPVVEKRDQSVAVEEVESFEEIVRQHRTDTAVEIVETPTTVEPLAGEIQIAESDDEATHHQSLDQEQLDQVASVVLEEPELVTLNVNNVDVRTILEMLAKGYGLNILVAPGVQGTVTANLTGLSPEQTLRSITRMCGLAIQREGEAILVYPNDGLPLDARLVRSFPLDFVRAETVEGTVRTLLSPIGTAYPTALDETDNRRGHESIVVIDVPEVIERVERYLLQADQPPRQVMIEARVLEIELTDGMEHGVNLEHLAGKNFRSGALRMADNLASSTNPFFFAEINGDEVFALLTLLQTTTDAKTLATPQVMVVNGQMAKIQVGQQLGYAVATVTQTSTIQDVRYLDTGIVLQVTPTISRDDRVLLQVKPKVSSGQINPETLLPEETTREVETSVMLGNHQGMIIGGLIQEDDRVVVRKLPWLGDVKHVGPLFQRRETKRSRSEIIVALIPHIMDVSELECGSHGDCEMGHCEIPDVVGQQDQWQRTSTRLFDGPLNRTCRPWEARLPDVAGEGHCSDEIDRIRNRHPFCKGCAPIGSEIILD